MNFTRNVKGEPIYSIELLDYKNYRVHYPLKLKIVSKTLRKSVMYLNSCQEYYPKVRML